MGFGRLTPAPKDQQPDTVMDTFARPKGTFINQVCVVGGGGGEEVGSG